MAEIINKELSDYQKSLIEEGKLTYEEAIKIYDTALTIIKNEIKNKLKHPFKSQD